jgi:hypothetical protein
VLLVTLLRGARRTLWNTSCLVSYPAESWQTKARSTRRDVPPIVALWVLSVSPGVGKHRADALHLVHPVARERARGGQFRVRRPNPLFAEARLQSYLREDLLSRPKPAKTALSASSTLCKGPATVTK